MAEADEALHGLTLGLQVLSAGWWNPSCANEGYPEICLITAHWDLLHYRHLFKNWPLTCPCFRKPCQNLHIQDIMRHPSLCVCVKHNWEVCFFLKVSTICKYQADWWCWKISYHLLENKNHVLGLSALQQSRLGRYFRGNVGEPLNHLESSIPPVWAQQPTAEVWLILTLSSDAESSV